MTKRKLKPIKPIEIPKPKKKHAGGRPKVIDKDVLLKLESAFGYGATDRQACHYAGIAPSTLYEYEKIHPEFSERKEELKEEPVMLARKEVIDGIRGNPELALKFLERRQKDEFSLRHELTGANGGAMNLSYEQRLEKLRAKINERKK